MGEYSSLSRVYISIVCTWYRMGLAYSLLWHSWAVVFPGGRTDEPQEIEAHGGRIASLLCPERERPSVSTIRPDDLHERLESGADEPFLLDIRPESAFEGDAIEDSHNLPVYDDLRGGDESALRDRLDEVPRDRAVVVVCKMGIVAKRATRLLDEEGYDAATLRGGMSGWRGYQKGSLSYKIRSLLWKLR